MVLKSRHRCLHLLNPQSSVWYALRSNRRCPCCKIRLAGKGVPTELISVNHTVLCKIMYVLDFT